MTASASGDTSGEASTTAVPSATEPSAVALWLSGPSSTTRLRPLSANSRMAAASAPSASGVVGVSRVTSMPTTAAQVLPSFGAYTGGLDVRDNAIASLLSR